MVVDGDGRRFGSSGLQASGLVLDTRSDWVVLSRVACWATYGVDSGDDRTQMRSGCLVGELASGGGRSKLIISDGGWAIP